MNIEHSKYNYFFSLHAPSCFFKWVMSFAIAVTFQLYLILHFFDLMYQNSVQFSIYIFTLYKLNVFHVKHSFFLLSLTKFFFACRLIKQLKYGSYSWIGIREIAFNSWSVIDVPNSQFSTNFFRRTMFECLRCKCNW